ncbi:MAG: 3-dehydroquinate synthase [Ruminococcaceae bacterium]|nr:3-dehydroquinate synthase [Oscillospiraceae bacterium]
MKTITVNASRSYPIYVGTELLANIGDYIPQVKSSYTIAIVSDSNVWPIYGNTVCASLKDRGYDFVHYVLPAGEESKNSEQYIRILNFLAENSITRGDLLIALGGGVVGDITGFAAATYLRGVPYIQVPTSLLAMVDSSVGGKTAIDLPAGKNLVGAFNQPAMVLCDISALNSLPEDIFTDGCAEVIKYGILYDAQLFSHLQTFGLQFDREYVITRCIELKRDVVMEDEFDTGARQMLNLGHTVGHSIEKCSNYSLSHGKAVAIGIAVIAKASASNGFCVSTIYDDIIGVLNRFTLPCSTSLSADLLAENALSDKKRFGGTINLVLPRKIGKCALHPIPVGELKSFFEAGL